MKNNCDEYTFICSECEGEMSDEPYGACRAVLKCETCEKEFIRLREVESIFIELQERFNALEKLHLGEENNDR